MWQIQSIPTTKIWVAPRAGIEPTEFVNVVSDNFVDDVSLEYIDGTPQQDALAVVTHTFSVAYIDNNVYQSGNDHLSVVGNGFTPAVDYMLVLSANQEDNLDVVAATFSAVETDMWIFGPNQEDFLDVVAATFTAVVTP